MGFDVWGPSDCHSTTVNTQCQSTTTTRLAARTKSTKGSRALVSGAVRCSGTPPPPRWARSPRVDATAGAGGGATAGSPEWSGGAAAQLDGAADELAHGLLVGAVGDECADAVLEVGGQALVGLGR